MNAKIVECYRILGLAPESSMADVCRKCQELEGKYDPDRFEGQADKEKAYARQRQVRNAAKWLEEFSSYGTSRLHPEDAEKQYALGNQYLAWSIGPEDYQEAVAQYRRAASQGHLNAQFALFEIYGDGLGLSDGYSYEVWRLPGIPQDKAEACKWVLLAAMNGHKSAGLNAGFYPQSLTPEEAAEAKRRVAAFLAERPWFRKSGLRKAWDRFGEWMQRPERPC